MVFFQDTPWRRCNWGKQFLLISFSTRLSFYTSPQEYFCIWIITTREDQKRPSRQTNIPQKAHRVSRISLIFQCLTLSRSTSNNTYIFILELVLNCFEGRLVPIKLFYFIFLYWSSMMIDVSYKIVLLGRMWFYFNFI